MIKFANNLNIFILKQAAANHVKEELVGDQDELDVNNNEQLDAEDFKLLRAKKQAAANPAKFVNHATDGSLALSEEGEYPQSYAFEEDAMATRAKIEGLGNNETPSAALTPREWSMLNNREVGIMNSSEDDHRKLRTVGAYGPSSMTDKFTGRPLNMQRKVWSALKGDPLRAAQFLRYTLPYGIGSMYNMTNNQSSGI